MMMVLMSDDAAREEQADVWCFCSVWPAAIIFQIVCHFKKSKCMNISGVDDGDEGEGSW